MQIIEMDFGVTKFAKLVVHRGKIVKSEGIKLPDGKPDQESARESHKYLGFLEADEVQQKINEDQPNERIL